MTHRGTREKVAGGPSASLSSRSPAWGRGATSDCRTSAKCLPWQSNSPCLGCLWQHSADHPSKRALHPFYLNNQFSCNMWAIRSVGKKGGSSRGDWEPRNSVIDHHPQVYSVKMPKRCWKDELLGLCQSLTFVTILLPVSKLELLTQLVWVSVKCGKCYQCTFHLLPDWEMLELFPMLKSL